MSKLKKYLLPVVASVITLCLILGMLSGCAPAITDSQQEISSPSLGEIFDPSGNPLAHRFSDEKDIRTATFVVAASNSVHRYDVDYRCSGANDHVQIQAALDRLPATGGYIFFLEGTYNLGAQVLRAIDDVKFMGCGQATLLNFNGVNPVITAGAQDGWLFSHFATDAGGVSIAGATQSAIRSVWIAGVRTDDPAAPAGGDALITVAADNTPAAQKARADFVCSGANDEVTIEALVAVGVTVKLMVGDYIFNGTLDIAVSNFRLEGSGPGTVISGILAVPYIRIGNNTDYFENVTICDLRIDGTNQTAGQGIFLDGLNVANRLDNIQILNCVIYDTDDECIFGEFVYRSLIQGNYINCMQSSDGISLYKSKNNVIDDNTCQNNRYGIYLDTDADGNTIIDNRCLDNQMDGMRIEEGDENTIVGNTCNDNVDNGISILGSSYNTIVGNTCVDQGSQDGIRLNGTAFGDADHNMITGNNCSQNADYGINVLGGTDANNNRIINNVLQGNGIAPFNDAGTNTKLATYVVPFSDGSDPQDSGFLIDANTEMARGWLRLPAEVQQVVRIRVYARSAVGETHEMELEMVVYGGADNQAYTTHNGSVAQLDSVSVNFAADDIIFWINTEAGTLALVGGDSVEIKVLHEAVEGDNIDTQAYFRTVEIEYV